MDKGREYVHVLAEGEEEGYYYYERGNMFINESGVIIQRIFVQSRTELTDRQRKYTQ